MEPVLLSSLISGAVSLLGGAMAQQSTRETNRMMLDQKEKDKIYNSPAESASRLRAAGFNPSLIGLDNAGISESVPIDSQANSILEASRQLSDISSGYGHVYLEQKRNEAESLKTEAEIQHLKNQDELAKMEFDRASLRDVYDFRKMDDEHLSDLIKNTDDLSSLAFQSALSGRKPVGLDAETQKKFDEALSRVNTESSEFKFAKSAIEKGLSINKLETLMAEQKSKYYSSNPLYDLMKYDETYKKAYNSLVLTRTSLGNDAMEMENDFNRSVNPSRQNAEIYNNELRFTESASQNHYFKKLLNEFSSLDKRLNSEEYMKGVSPAVASMLRQERARYQQLLEKIFFDNTLKRGFTLPFVGEAVQSANDYGLNPIAILSNIKY